MKTKYKFLFWIALFPLFVAFISTSGYTREIKYNRSIQGKDTLTYKTITGKIIDKDTKKPVVFANIYINGLSVGTVSNSDGEFIIKIPKAQMNKMLGITFLGYKNVLIPIKDLKSEDNLITLEVSPIPINEVIIRTGDPVALIRGAMKNIRQNYQTVPENQVGFYREFIKQNRNYIEVAEAVLDVYKASYIDDFGFDRIKIYKGRKSHDVKKMDTVLFKFQGGPKTSFLLDMVKTPGNLLSEDMFELYNFKLIGLTSINDRENYIIEFDQRDDVKFPLYQGKIFLDVKTLAITSVEFKFSEKGIDLAGNELIRKKPVSMNLNLEAGNYLINYRELNGKWFLNHVRSELVFKCKWDKKFFRSTYVTGFEMAVTDRDTASVNKFKFKESAKISDVFADQVNYFVDEDFWGEYNYIKPDESIEMAIAKLNKKLKLREN